MERDRNLLFGVLAVQLGKVTPAQLMEVAAAWATDPTRGLAQRLVEAGTLSAKDSELITGFADHAVAAHEGDASAALSSFGGEEQVQRSFAASAEVIRSGEITPSLERTLDLPSSGGTTTVSVPTVRETPGRYTGASEHGRGGIGHVLLVHDQCIGRDVALKELLPQAQQRGAATEDERTARQTTALLSRFLQEARVTGQLEHPAIVPVYELGKREDGGFYYTMKLVRGRTLANALRTTTSLESRLALLAHFMDLCQAIAYAHSRGVIHRDIKPANVMVGEFGETVVIDWGLAKVKGREDILAGDISRSFQILDMGQEAGLSKTVFGTALGTPMYMAPEQARGELEAVDERSDIYSLGAVLYEILTAQPPFTGSSVLEIISLVGNERPKPVTAIERDAPPELSAICQRAMERDPAARFQSAKELAAEVQRFLSGALVHTYRYSFAEHLRRFVQRHRPAVATAAVLLLVLIAVLAGASGWNLRERRRAEREARTARSVLDFLVGVFELADPSEARGSTVTAREIVDRGAKGIADHLTEEPAARAELLLTVGVVYRQLGLYRDAEPLLEEALTTRRQVLGDNHPKTAEAMNRLGHLWHLQGRYRDSIALNEEALAVWERARGSDSPEVADTLNNIAMSNEALGHYGTAIAQYERALRVWTETLGEDDPKVAAALNNIANVHGRQGRFDEALPLFQRALEVRESAFGGNHPEVGKALSNLANVYLYQGKLDQALDHYQRALAIFEKTLGPDHTLVATVLNGIAAVHANQGRYEEAIPLFERALEVWTNAFGDHHPQVANVHHNLAKTHYGLGQLQQAIPLFERALMISEQTLGPDHPAVTLIVSDYANVLREAGRSGEAARLEARAERMRQEAQGGAAE